MVDQLPPDHSSAAPAAQRPVQAVVQKPNPMPVSAAPQHQPVNGAGRPSPSGLKQKLLAKKYWLLLILLLLVFGGVGGFVPVSQVPVLSSLARAMGYSEEQMQEMSFLKTLLFWADDERGPAARIAANSYSIFSTQPGRFDAIKRGAAAYGAVGEESSSLIDFQAVNASLRRQGKSGDYLASVAPDTGDDRDKQGVRFNKGINQLSKDARASAQAQTELYYGTDTGLIARDPKDGFDGSAALKNLKAGVIGSQKSDWKADIVNKAILEQTSGLDKKLGGPSSAMMQLQNAGRTLTDFRYIWLTSQASSRAKQVPLKKTLAAAGFFAEEMPQKVFSATGGIAVAGLEEDDVVADIETAEEQQKRQQECEDASRTVGPRITEMTSSVIAQINALQGTFPAFPGDCANTAKVNNWRTSLAQVRNACSQVKKDYSTLQDKCYLQLKYNRTGQCSTNNLDDKLNEYERMCAEYLQDKANAGEGAEIDLSIYNPEQFSNQQVTESVQGTFNVPVWGNSGGTSTPNDFFPETDLSGSQGWSYLE